MASRTRIAAVAALAGLGGLVGAYMLYDRGLFANVPEPAKPVELSRYLGRWYELGRYENRFERGCDAVTADYSLRPDGLISVVNTCGISEKHDGPRSVTGRAKVLPDTANTKLKVSFFGPFYLGNYWVLDRAEDYSWSIVGEPTGRYLWLLGREPNPGRRAINNLVARAAALGYDAARIRRTRHPR